MSTNPTEIPDFKGHRGVATVAVMSNGRHVIIMTETMTDLEMAFCRLVPGVCAPFNPDITRMAIIISIETLEQQNEPDNRSH